MDVPLPNNQRRIPWSLAQLSRILDRVSPWTLGPPFHQHHILQCYRGTMRPFLAIITGPRHLLQAPYTCCIMQPPPLHCTMTPLHLFQHRPPRPPWLPPRPTQLRTVPTPPPACTSLFSLSKMDPTSLTTGAPVGDGPVLFPSNLESGLH